MKIKNNFALCAVFLSLCFAICAFFASCSKKGVEVQGAGQSDIVHSEKSNSPFSADIDFVDMNYNMVSSSIFNILIDAEKFLGKTVRFRGEYFETNDSGADEALHSCLIYDATACCQTGLQFELPQGKVYPKEHENIEIFGTLSYKEINGMDYFFVACKDFTLLPVTE